MKITVELTEQQAYTVMEALEEYSRIGMTQFDQIEYRLHLDTYDKSLKRPKYDQELAKEYLQKAKEVIFGKLEGAYIGILNTSERSKISWDIYQQLRHDISVYKFPNEPLESRGRCFDKPLVTSKQPLPKITINEG